MSSPLSVLPSSPLSTLSSPPVSPNASADDNKEVSRSQHFSYDSSTPKKKAVRAKTTKQPYADTSNASLTVNRGNDEAAAVDDVLTSPSWDVNNNTNFFRDGAAKPQPQPQLPQLEEQSIYTSRSFFDRFTTGGGGVGRSNQPKHNRASFDTKSRGASSEEEDSALEAGENDLFAQEVGLMFSTDDGDTIRDENLFAQSLSKSMSRGLSASFSFGMDTASHRTPSNRLRKMTQGRRRESNKRQQKNDDDSVGNNNNYLQNTKYAVGGGTQPTPTPRNNEPDIMSVHTSGQATTLSNQIPTNAKMILGYKNARKHRNQASTTAGPNQAFPLITGDNPISQAEMEKRLREIAGQLNADWREPSFMPPALARRLRDFQFARAKRTKRYGASRPWGILGLYDHLSGVKVDVEWAEDAAWRRQHNQPYQTWGDFEKAKNKGLNSPFFTHFTVSVCTAMMIASLQVNGWRFEPIAVNPMIGPSAETLLKLGAKDSYLIVDEMEVWRVASPMVLHAGLIHFFLNMFALWFVGRAVEQIHGMIAAVVLFVVPAIGGTILSAIFLPEYITVGASGGIFGLIGACISDIFMNWNLLFNKFVNENGARLSHARVLLVLAVDIVVNCLIGLTPFVDNFTHLGGMVYGFLCGLGMIQLVSPKFFQKDNAKSPSCCSRSKRFFFRFFGVLISLAGIVISSIVLMSGDGETNPCTSCSYMSCIAFPPWNGQNNKWWYCDDCARATATGTMENGIFSSLNVTCPNGMHEVLKVEESWPQDELGLEGLLPMLCREHCLW
eukprot:scaffold5539_cov81-Skeletonema_menzelii.AAC.3